MKSTPQISAILKHLSMALFMVIFGMPAAVAQSFPCDGKILFGASTGTNRTTIYEVIFGPFGTLTFAPRYRYQRAEFNGLGFNPLDNHIYGTVMATGEIARLSSDGTYEIIGQITEVESATVTAGECTADGYYICHVHELDQLLVYSVMDEFRLVDRIDLAWDRDASQASGPFTPRIDDLVIDPRNPDVAYSYQGNYFDADLEPDETKGFILRIDINLNSPDRGRVTPITKIPTPDMRKIGGLMFGPNGRLYGYGAADPGPDPIQNLLFTVDISSGQIARFQTQGPRGNHIDGCSCPYSLGFTNFANPTFAFCTDDQLSYTLTLSNRFFDNIDGTTLTDTFPTGMIISGISGNYSGTISDGSGIGTNVLHIESLAIPARSEVEILVTVDIIDLNLDLIAHQGILTNLPERFGASIVSDDPETVSFVGDSTRIFSEAQDIVEFDIEVIQPDDCLDEFSSSISVTSPVFIPDNVYRVSMRDEEFQEYRREVRIRADNTMLIDSLNPGAYDLYAIVPVTSRCGFSMKDTTIIVEGPNDLIQASASSNQPICEGQTLELSAMVDPPAGQVFWQGPGNFKSDDIEARREMPVASQSGEYDLIFTYGICKQVETLDIAIEPAVNGEVDGPAAFCVGDTIRLSGDGEGDLTTSTWRLDGEIIQTGAELVIPSAISSDDGTYEVILSNGGCADTILQEVIVNPTPIIELPTQVTSTFCDPVILSPEILETQDVNFEWSTSAPLDCPDCAEIEFSAPPDSSVQLRVSTPFGCQDEAMIDVLLDKQDLIYVPNVYSPNRDGLHDYFQVTPNCGVSMIVDFAIYDRFGSEMYRIRELTDMDDPRVFWNGFLKGLMVNEGVYLWQMEIQLVDGTTQHRSGDLTVVR
ncbi:MAG: gliding motility-associated C-terminal domain-containing protein [Bacteroidota bacterium]